MTIRSIVVIVFLMSVFTLNGFAQGCMEASSDEGVALKGFLQPQYSYNLNEPDASGNNQDENSFFFNRARIGVLGAIPYDFEYYFFMEMSPFKDQSATPHLLDAYVSYTRFAPHARVTLGQFKSPFSQEQNTACSGLYSINRSNAVNQLAGPQRDLGLMISGGSDTTLLRYSVAVMNGSGKGIVDNTKGKDFVGRVLVQPLDFLRFGGSFRVGKTLPTDITEKENDIYRFAGELQFKMSNFMLQGEYIHGIDKLYSAARVPIYGGCGGIVGFDTKVAGDYSKSGYYVMATYLTRWGIEPMIKYDSYDPDLDAKDDWTNTITAGFSWYANDWSRLQINYINVQEKTAIMNDMIVLQLQAKF